MQNDYIIRETQPSDKFWIQETMKKDWGGEPLIIRAKEYYPTALNGLLAIDKDQKVIGFLFYDIQGKDCEIVVFQAYEKFKGIGTQLLNKLKIIATKNSCRRIYLMTHNDNLDALRFYQRRDFHICGIHLNSMEKAREIKPCIGMIGDYEIPIRDEIDLEMIITA